MVLEKRHSTYHTIVKITLHYLSTIKITFCAKRSSKMSKTTASEFAPTYLKSQVTILKWVGLWNTFENPVPRLMYKVFSFIVIAPMIVQMVGSAVNLFVDKSEPDISTINITFTIITAIIKCILFGCNHRGLRNVAEEINKITGTNEQEKRTIQNYEWKSKLLMTSFMCSGVMCNVSFTVGTIMIFYGFVGGEKQLLLKAWYPFDVEQNIEVVVLLQLLFGVSICLTVGMTDTFLVGLMIHLGGQFQIVSMSLANVEVEVKKKVNEYEEKVKGRIKNPIRKFHVKKSGQAFEISTSILVNESNAKKVLKKQSKVSCEVAVSSREFKSHTAIARLCAFTEQTEELSYELLIKLIRKHQVLLSVSRELQKVVSPIIFVQMLMSSIVLCLAAVKLTQIDGLNAELISYMTYTNIMMMQMGMYCIFGDYLTTKGEEVADAAYRTQWYQLSKRYNYALRFLIQRAQKPVLLVGEGFYVLSRETFMQICMSSASYFMVLRKVLQEK